MQAPPGTARHSPGEKAAPVDTLGPGPQSTVQVRSSLQSSCATAGPTGSASQASVSR
jgi:hypothetical protein